MRMKKNFLRLMVLGLTVFAAAVMPVSAQTEPDPATLEAKEETAVVYDLGRFFGYVHDMTTEISKLALTASQKSEIKKIMGQIKEMDRVEPDWAEETLDYLELELLTAAQLMEVDRRAIEWQNSREPSIPGSGAGGGSGTGPISSYIAGGPFNPLIDDSKNIGQGFADFYDYLK